ncbi:MAG TPA: hypothetical protein VH475_17475, partial [Tepidisphaeraceae bacterium]
MRRSIRAGLGILVLGGTFTAVYVTAAPGPAAAPAAASGQKPAATEPPARRELVMPPGYEKVTVAGHTALCEPNDAAWVKQALGDV